MVREALILTGIGIGTAFGLLVAMMVGILLVKLVATRFVKGAAEDAAGQPAEARDRALAAVIAVSAVLGNQDRSALPGADG